MGNKPRMPTSSYFNWHEKDFNPYQVLTIYPTKLGIFGSLTFHELMLADTTRVNSFKRAIEQIGRKHPNLVCLDIGSGIGTLALLCAKFGYAKQVYAIEQNSSILELSKEVAKAQGKGVSNKIQFLHGKSFDLNLPEKAGLLVTETIGNFGVEEGLVSLLNDAKKRFLHKDATIVPSELEFFAAPIESQRCHRRISFWKGTRYGIDLSILSAHASSRLYHHRVLLKELLGKPCKVGGIRFNDASSIQDKLSLNGTCTITRNGTLHGFAGWFRARLFDNIYLSNDPRKKRGPFNWTQVFFPLPDGDKKLQKVVRGQKVAISIKWNLVLNRAFWNCKYEP